MSNFKRKHKPRSSKKRKIPPQTLILEIEEIGANGDGVARHNDMRIFVPKTMAGDNVQIRIEGGVKDGCHANLISVETASPNRMDAPCPHFATCGGCALQHLGEDAYRAWKIKKAKSILARAGVAPKHWDEPIFLPDAGRRRTTLAVQKLSDKKIQIGYHTPRSHNINDITQCKILDSALERLILGLRPYLLCIAPMRRSVDLTIQVAGGVDMVLTGDWQDDGDFTLQQHEAIAEMMQKFDIARLSLRHNEFAAPLPLLERKDVIKTFGALSVFLPPATFLQASDSAEKTLTDIVLSYAKGAKNAADLFCGCGTFAGHLIDAGIKTHAVDGDDAAMNALSANTHEILSTQRRNLFKAPLSQDELTPFDTVIFDPPRAGAKAQSDALSYSSVEKIVAVSCNPATFARDASILTDAGYTLERITLIDQFIWSSHMELVALFTQ